MTTEELNWMSQPNSRAADFTMLWFLSICPRIYRDHDRMVAATSWKLVVLLLGFCYRRVEIDPRREELTIRSRAFWLLTRTRRIPFRFIEAVTYGYQDWAIANIFSHAHDSFDVFNVGIRLHGDLHDTHLFNFVGEGSFQNESHYPDWYYWDRYAFDFSGTQEAESKVFAELLGTMIGVEIIPATI